MANEQIEQKKQQLKQLAEEVKQLKDELVEAGAWPLDEKYLNDAAGGLYTTDIRPVDKHNPHLDPFPHKFM